MVISSYNLVQPSCLKKLFASKSHHNPGSRSQHCSPSLRSTSQGWHQRGGQHGPRQTKEEWEESRGQFVTAGLEGVDSKEKS